MRRKSPARIARVIVSFFAHSISVSTKSGFALANDSGTSLTGWSRRDSSSAVDTLTPGWMSAAAL